MRISDWSSDVCSSDLQFSCQFDVGTAANAARAMTMLDAYQSDLDQADDGCLGFDCSIEELEPTKLWLRDDGGFGEIEHVIGFVLRCAEAFDMQGMWGFGCALTCSTLRLDGFGGGEHIIEIGARRTLVWIDCGH